MNFKKNIPLIVGISLPILMIIFVGVSIYIPGIFVQPKYNFLYSNLASYNNKYYVSNNHIAINPNYRSDYNYSYNEPKIFVHDIKTNKSQKISFEEAQKFILDSNNTSPDGFRITSGGSGGFFLFYSDSSYRNKYLSNGTVSKKLNLNFSGYYDFSFLGWIIK